KRRLESAYQFEFFDRVPVLLGIRSSVSRLHSGCMTSLVATGSDGRMLKRKLRRISKSFDLRAGLVLKRWFQCCARHFCARDGEGDEQEIWYPAKSRRDNVRRKKCLA
ncbi:MAG TPA: hypothetical protein VGB89_04600, partial [Bacteroidota bacterium]